MVDTDAQNPQRGQKMVAELARRAVEALRKDAKGEFQELVKSYEGCSAVVGIFGMGSVTVAVSGGEVLVDDPGRSRDTKLLGRGAAYPETIIALSEGKMTPLEAFHTGDLVVRAPSEELHKAYGLMVRMSDVVVRSSRLQGILKEFRSATAS